MKCEKSAGILIYKKEKDQIYVMLVHPGGLFWKNKDAGAWSIPKGEFMDDEEPLAAAKRGFEEETGLLISGKFLPLTPVKQKSGKLIYAWAVEANVNSSSIKSNFFEMEWPPRPGKTQRFPEIDKAGWFIVDEAKEKIVPGQFPFILDLLQLLQLRKRLNVPVFFHCIPILFTVGHKNFFLRLDIF